MIPKIKNYISQIIILRSLKVRIFLIIFLAGIIPSIVMRFGILENYVDRAVEVREKDVQNQIQILANHLTTYSYLQDTSSGIVNAELDQLSTLYDGRVLIINQNFSVIKDTYGISEGKTIISEEVIKCFKGENSCNYDATNHYIEVTTPIIDKTVLNTASTTSGDAATATDAQEIPAATESEPAIMGVLLISVSTDSIIINQEILSRKAAILEMAMAIIIFGIVFLLSAILIRPFNRVADAIHAVKEGFADEVESVPDYLETEHIIDAYSQVASRMKVLDDSRQEFVSNVSHELKTPLTSMKVLADSLLMQKDAPIELYQEFMEDIANEIDRENKIINDLLSLVKMDKTAADLNISNVNINEQLELILKRLTPIANKQNVELIFESMRQVDAEIDEVKLTLAFSNLVENAIKYNKEKGWVRITLDADHQFFTVEVADSGIGIPQESLDQIYERFYRVDKSHSREIGGTGLGLAITRNAILMHRGSIKAASVEGEGTTFTVKIPLSYIA
ncbi:MAG: ATP-binding protein [Lachnospiraceae bacterium]|nr:ATP-binding protein [Lachnospiraceae bacterium]